MRPFCASKSAAKLKKTLSKELEFEKDNYTELEDTKVFLKESGFTLTEDKEGINLYLKKTVEGKEVTVHFQARQPNPEEEQPEEKPEGQEGQEEEDYNTENMADFSVYIKLKDDTGLIFDCTTNETEVSINNVMHTKELSKMSKVSRWERNYNHYAGPDFSSLDERVQTGLQEYLQSFGINEHLASFVEVMSLDKDQRLYMQWLEDVENFLK